MLKSTATRPHVWVSVDDRPDSSRPNDFLLARRVREGLRLAGLPATLFSVRESLESLLGRAAHEVVFPLDTIYTQRGFRRDPFGLLRALEGLGVPYVGSSYTASATAYDKERAKRILSLAGVAVPGGICLREKSEAERAASHFRESFSGPVVLKPVSGPGGSYGVEFIANGEALLRRLSEWAHSREGSLLVEEFIKGQEVSAWVLGVEPRLRCHSILTVEKGGRPIYDREAKRGLELLRAPDDEEYRRAVTRTRPLSERERSRAAETALRAHRALGAYSYSRIDMVIRRGVPFVLEVNVRPNLSPGGALSITRDTRLSYSQLVAQLVHQALLRD